MRMTVKIMIALLIVFGAFYAVANYDKRGINSRYEWHSAKGDGSDTLPYKMEMDVNIQDQTSRALDLYFLRTQDSSTLSTPASKDDKTLTLTSALAFLAGRAIGIFAPDGHFFYGRQIGPPVGNVITLDSPIDSPFAVGSRVVTADYNANVNGSVTAQIFSVGLPFNGTSLDVTRVIIYLQDGTAMDDSRFGGITALTNGVVLRKTDGSSQNIWNVKSNGEFALISYDAMYSDKAPAGSYGFRTRNTYAGQDKHGVTIRVLPGERLELIIQDDLTGLDVFYAMAQGHIVADY